MKYENTLLWRNAMSQRPHDKYAAERDRLRAAYAEFWTNAVVLGAQISKDLPGLTLHDEIHFQALWDRADQILGTAEPLNPLETFIFGSSILLHDAANCIAAYPGKLAEIEASPEWRDEVADRLRAAGMDTDRYAIENASEEIRKPALFNALRRLHAARAEDIANLSFVNNKTGHTHHLLPNEHLRVHLSRTIGLISASHNWDIQDIPKRLQKTLGAIPAFPNDWAVRPVRLACLLRCADALQIDQSRAPDFLFALLDLRGLSETHWRAQNFLAAPTTDPDDENALIFTSTRDFAPGDAEAWWIAHDAVAVANRELQDSYSLLKDLRQPTFQITRIRDADAPERLSSHITTCGWRPISAEVRIRNVENVVRMFGGKELYGDNFSIPLRELIQNAADAVRFRREIASEINYSGEITVRLRNTADADVFWLEVEDDGLGMSEAGLTGPLIDFGATYFGSSLAKWERPGLTASSVKTTGRYGIGFFSVFMLGGEIDVASRPFDASLSETRTLRFMKGLSLRPLILEDRPKDFSSLVSTRVAIKLSRETLEKILSYSVGMSSERKSISLIQLVGYLCPLLDVDLYVEEPGNERQLVHPRFWWQEDREQWLRRVTVAPLRDASYGKHLKKAASLLAQVDAGDPTAGLASIPIARYDAAIPVVGGFTADPFGGPRIIANNPTYLGCLDHEPSGPRRQKGNVRAQALMADWASNQANRIARLNLDLEARRTAAIAVAAWNGDPTPVAAASVGRVLRTLEEIVEMLGAGATLTAAMPKGFLGEDSMIADVRAPVMRLAFDNSDEVRVLDTVIEGTPVGFPEYYYKVVLQAEKGANTFVGCLRRAAARYGELSITITKDTLLGYYVGLNSDRDRLRSGAEIRGRAALISLNR